MTTLSRHAEAQRSAPYVVPFAAFMALLLLRSVIPAPPFAEQVAILAAMIVVLVVIARPALDLSLRAPVSSVLLGIAIFVIWIAPDVLFPNYRHHLENPVTGALKSTLAMAARGNTAVLALRTLRAVIIVPLVEELFWRAWLMRWLISPDFLKVPLGTFTPMSFWVVAALFASEHGPFWDVGLAAGILYNWWMVRTRSLGDLVLAHAVTNACLSAYVIAAGKWEYWM